MKVMDKARLFNMRSIDAVKQEMRVLASITHPFILNLRYVFQDTYNLYFVSDLLKGGTLRYYLD